ncbi:MAG: hypothetical protein ACRD3R_04545, partial [Terriglobales bacterium]
LRSLRLPELEWPSRLVKVQESAAAGSAPANCWPRRKNKSGRVTMKPPSSRSKKPNVSNQRTTSSVKPCAAPVVPRKRKRKS